MLIDFENIEEKCNKASESDEYAVLVRKVNRAKKIFLIGNGGLHYVASHMATDLTRLIPNKAVFSFDSVGFITSNANDHGYVQIFKMAGSYYISGRSQGMFNYWTFVFG